MITPGPQKMRFLHPGWPTYRGYRGLFTHFPRRRDDPNTQKFHRCPVGAVPILRRGTAPELTPLRGSLKTTIRSLAEKTWRHPVTGCDVQFTAVSIERRYYMARRERDDPLRVLRPAVRKDCGKVSLAPRWPSGSASSTAIILTGVTNCTMTISPRSWRPSLRSGDRAVIPR